VRSGDSVLPKAKGRGPKDVFFSLLTKDSVIGLQLFIPGFSENDVTLKQIGYLMLDDALGEYDVETKIGLIQMLPSAIFRPLASSTISGLEVLRFCCIAFSLSWVCES
jgi:hypothetical protein